MGTLPLSGAAHADSRAATRSLCVPAVGVSLERPGGPDQWQERIRGALAWQCAMQTESLYLLPLLAPRLDHRVNRFILHVNAMSGVAAQQELSFQWRLEGARHKNVSPCGERLPPEDTTTVPKHRRTNLRLHRVNAILTVVFHLTYHNVLSSYNVWIVCLSVCDSFTNRFSPNRICKNSKSNQISNRKQSNWIFRSLSRITICLKSWFKLNHDWILAFCPPLVCVSVYLSSPLAPSLLHGCRSWPRC